MTDAKYIRDWQFSQIWEEQDTTGVWRERVDTHVFSDDEDPQAEAIAIRAHRNACEGMWPKSTWRRCHVTALEVHRRPADHEIVVRSRRVLEGAVRHAVDLYTPTGNPTPKNASQAAEICARALGIDRAV